MPTQKQLEEIADAASDPATVFFYEQAGWCYDPKIETSDQGKMRCAVALAKAERHAKSVGVQYQWRVDQHTDSREFSDEKPYYSLWSCFCYRNGECINSLHGIDFGRGKKPHGDPYKRVVEAELALEDWHEKEESQDAACRDIATV